MNLGVGKTINSACFVGLHARKYILNMLCLLQVKRDKMNDFADVITC